MSEMTLLDYLAANVLPGLVTMFDPDYSVKEAYRLAGLMIEEREKIKRAQEI